MDLPGAWVDHARQGVYVGGQQLPQCSVSEYEIHYGVVGAQLFEYLLGGGVSALFRTSAFASNLQFVEEDVTYLLRGCEVEGLACKPEYLHFHIFEAMGESCRHFRKDSGVDAHSGIFHLCEDSDERELDIPEQRHESLTFHLGIEQAVESQGDVGILTHYDSSLCARYRLKPFQSSAVVGLLGHVVFEILEGQTGYAVACLRVYQIMGERGVVVISDRDPVAPEYDYGPLDIVAHDCSHAVEKPLYFVGKRPVSGLRRVFPGCLRIDG